jgi:hypothetical protein
MVQEGMRKLIKGSDGPIRKVKASFKKAMDGTNVMVLEGMGMLN